MDQLPAELMSEIARFCDRDATFRLRAANKYLENMFTPLAFETVYVGWIEKHFRYLEYLAESCIAQHIRCIVINTEVLPIEGGSRSWLMEVRETLLDGMSHGLLANYLPLNDDDEDEAAQIANEWHTEEDLEAGKIKFYELAADQQRFGSTMCRILAKVLTMCEHVRRLELIDNRGMYGEKNGYKNPLKNPVAACSPWKGMLIAPDSYYSCLKHRWQNDEFQSDYDNVSSALALHYIAHALALHSGRRTSQYSSSLRELRMVIGHHISVSRVFENSLLQSCDICEDMTVGAKSGLAFFSSMFSQLTQVNLSMHDKQSNRALEVCREIATGLSFASNLRHLVVNTREVHCPDLFTEIATLNVQRPWPLLEHFRITGTIVSEELTQFLNLCCDSLRVFELDDVVLVDTAHRSTRWDDCFEVIQPSLNLQEAHVRQLFGAVKGYKSVLFPHGGAKSETNLIVESFLTKRIEKLPRLEEWDFTPLGYNPMPSGWSAPIDVRLNLW